MKSAIRCSLVVALLAVPYSDATAELKAGAAVVDATPIQFPVLVNGGMLSRSASTVKTPINARAIVLDDGQHRLGIVVVDSCMMPRPLLDDAKQLAAQRTKIAPDRMLISATHTHTAPSCMGCLGTNEDPTYIPFLREKIAESLATAEANLEPAHVGWSVENASEFTALRRWIRRPDRIVEDPFGNPTVRANMHAGRNWDDVTGESGPEDPDLSLIAFQSIDGRPIAVLANFSMHYFGDQALTADYFGLFCEGLKSRAATEHSGDHAPFVGILSHGCSGDIWRRDYTTKPVPSKTKDHTIQSYAEGMLAKAMAAYEAISYQDDADLSMSEARLQLNYRTPDKQRLEWAQRIMETMGDRDPKDQTEVYAREQVILHKRQSTEVVVQAIRIGEIAIATTPTETYALTGLKLKLQSPLQKTMVIELANGGDGYIPPPEQHLLGGYNTWPARSAGLEKQAEPKITEAALCLLEEVAGRPRRPFKQSRGPTVDATIEAKPVAYWRMDEFAGPRVIDTTEHNCDAIYEPAVAFFLAGPQSDGFCERGETNRAAHFAGGRVRLRIAGLGDSYSVAFWFWNGMPNDARETAGWMSARGREFGLIADGDHLGICGTEGSPGTLKYLRCDGQTVPQAVIGRTQIERWEWNHAVLVRDDSRVRVFLNGNPEPEIETESPAGFPDKFDRLFFGGRCDGPASFEGRLDEIARFDRALSGAEIKALATK